MEDLLNYFQKQFLERISIKAGSRNENQVIINAFKYYDLNRSGTLEFGEWCSALEKLGAKLLPEKELYQIFHYFDVDGSGSLNYKEFTRMIYNPLKAQNARPAGFGQGGNGGLGPQDQDLASQRPLAETLEIVREKVRARGAAGIVGLGRLFRIMDDSKSHSLEFPEFYKAMQEYRIGLEDWEIRDIFDFFDLDQNGTLNYNEFLIGMRGPLSKTRLELIDYVFDCLDKDQSGYIEIDDIADLYDTSKSKEVKEGRKTHKEVLQDFLGNFEGNFTIKGYNDGKINRDEFLDYYGFISASIDSDEAFQELMFKNWHRVFERAKKLEGERKAQQAGNAPVRRTGGPVAGGQGEGYSQYQQDRQASRDMRLEQILKEVRQNLAKRGMRGFVGIQRQFRIMDEDRDGYLVYPEFLKAMKDFRVGVNDNTILAIFNEFDRDKNSKLDIEEFTRAMVGEISALRRSLVERVFYKLDRNGNGILREDEITKHFYARGHPEFKSGKMAIDSVYSDFVDTFKEHQNLQGGKKGSGITKQQFIDYYNNVSSTCEDDAYFERVVSDCWRLDEPENNSKKEPQVYYGKGKRSNDAAQNYKYTTPWGISESGNDWKTSNEAIGNPNRRGGVERGGGTRYY